MRLTAYPSDSASMAPCIEGGIRAIDAGENRHLARRVPSWNGNPDRNHPKSGTAPHGHLRPRDRFCAQRVTRGARATTMPPRPAR